MLARNYHRNIALSNFAVDHKESCSVSVDNIVVIITKMSRINIFSVEYSSTRRCRDGNK